MKDLYRGAVFVLTIIISVSVTFSHTAYSATESFNNQYVKNEVIIKYKKAEIDLDSILGQMRALNFNSAQFLKKKENLEETNISLLVIKDGETVEQKIAELEKNPNIEYVQPNYQYFSQAIETNDPLRESLWALYNAGQKIQEIEGTSDADIDAPEAWILSEQGIKAPIIAAVIDTGIAYNHPDLADNMWDGTNCLSYTGEFLGGCVHGYDFKNNSKTPLPYDIHGTHVAGILAAVKNNEIGVVGVAPNAKIMAIATPLTTAEIIKSINFAKYNGARVINASWAGEKPDTALREAIEAFPGIFIAAAANNDNGGTDNDKTAYYPASFNLENIISVAATDQNDNLAGFSNYGATSVDVGAPGVNILSTAVKNENDDGSDNLYEYHSGTSMAAPHVTGLATLIWGYKPDLTTQEVKTIILETGDELTSLSGKTVTGKRINAYRALQSLIPLVDISASLTANPITGFTTTVFNFTASRTDGNATGEITYTNPDCGTDGVLSGYLGGSDNTFSCTYSSAGSKTISIEVSQEGATSVPTASVTVSNPPPTNSAPTISTITISPLSITLPTNTVTLSVTAADDGLPNPPGSLSYHWEQAGGPDGVSISNFLEPTATASLTQAGSYSFRVTVSDSTLSTSQTVGIVVDAEPILSSVNTVSSETYTVNNDDSTITGVEYGTSKEVFLEKLVGDDTKQTWDTSRVSNPVVSENLFTVIAQDETTKSYVITVSPKKTSGSGGGGRSNIQRENSSNEEGTKINSQDARTADVEVDIEAENDPKIKVMLKKIEELKKVVEMLTALLLEKTGISTSPTQQFNRSIKMGDSGSDVLILQKKLNQLGFTVALSGAGSPGLETTYYGPRTTDALRRFQCAYGIVCSGTAETTGYGSLNFATISMLNTL